ncbi:D-alanyl-D-alanine dipeptidase [Litchfieldia alkalitelluris]|nr:D-alanyl-D-alanine dipeptidase [Litchfieldia alkalitelluris]
MKKRKQILKIIEIPILVSLILVLVSGCSSTSSTQMEAELENLEAQLMERESDYAEIVETNGELEERISLLVEEKTTLASDNDKFLQENEDLKIEVESLLMKLEEIERERIAQLSEETGLVNILDIDDTIVVDMPYATDDNFVEQAVYPVEVALLQVETAKKLKQANELAKEDGYRIKVWDGYRPHDVQFVFWELTPDRDYVGDPNQGSNHNRGAAVDVTLVDEEGNELEMPTGFDEFSERAWLNYQGNSDEAQKNMEYLVNIMRQSGFTTINIEWWHFNDSNARNYPVLNVPLEDFVPGVDISE